MHAYTTLDEDYPNALQAWFALLTQNVFGHPEIKIQYVYEFLAIQLNLPVDDRSIYSLDAKTFIVGQILIYIQSKRFWFLITQ